MVGVDFEFWKMVLNILLKIQYTLCNNCDY